MGTLIVVAGEYQSSNQQIAVSRQFVFCVPSNHQADTGTCLLQCAGK